MVPSYKARFQRIHVKKKKPYVQRPLFSKATNKFAISMVKVKLMQYAIERYPTAIFLV